MTSHALWFLFIMVGFHHPPAFTMPQLLLTESRFFDCVDLGKWEGHPFYSPSVEKLLGASSPFEQGGLAISTLVGVSYGIKSLLRSSYVLKASTFPIDSDDRHYYKHLGRVTDEQLRSAAIFSRMIRARGRIAVLLAPSAWMGYLYLKHKK